MAMTFSEIVQLAKETNDGIYGLRLGSKEVSTAKNPDIETTNTTDAVLWHRAKQSKAQIRKLQRQERKKRAMMLMNLLAPKKDGKSEGYSDAAKVAYKAFEQNEKSLFDAIPKAQYADGTTAGKAIDKFVRYCQRHLESV